MDDVDIPSPNKALAEILLSAKMFGVVRAKTEFARTRWQAVVAKKTGKLSRSTRVTVQIGGYKNDRPVGTLTVGSGVRYGASHQYGHLARRSKTTGRFVAGGRRRKVKGAKELNMVLRTLRQS